MLEEGTLPIRQSASDPAALAEERRLLYVGITRARRHLVLSWAANRIGTKGSAVRARPSRFIAELRPNEPDKAAARCWLTAEPNKPELSSASCLACG